MSNILGNDFALLLIDLQNDFCPGGSLAVPRGDEVVPVASRLIPIFERVIATQDWHPREHGSFAANHPDRKPGEVIELDGIEQILWPIHCVQGSEGAEFVEGLDSGDFEAVFRKGTDPLTDSYSAFFDNARRRETGLRKYLLDNPVRKLFVLGLATDYCVKFSVLDACELGFEIAVIVDGCRGVNLQPLDSEKAFQEMEDAGAILLESQEFMKEAKKIL